jgi:hypothetical protein
LTSIGVLNVPIVLLLLWFVTNLPVEVVGHSAPLKLLMTAVAFTSMTLLSTRLMTQLPAALASLVGLALVAMVVNQEPLWIGCPRQV